MESGLRMNLVHTGCSVAVIDHYRCWFELGDVGLKRGIWSQNA